MQRKTYSPEFEQKIVKEVHEVGNGPLAARKYDIDHNMVRRVTTTRTLVPLSRGGSARSQTLEEISGSPLFEPTNLDWEKYLHLGVKRYYPKGSVIIQANTYLNNIFYLKSGVIKQSLISSEGKEKIIGIIKAGNIFGEAIFFNRCPAQCSNIAMENSLVYVFSREAIEKMLELNPNIMIHFVRSMSLKIRMLTTQINMLYSLSAKTKVYKLIYLLSQSSTHGSVRLTHQEMAQLAGVHRVTVSRTIALLKHMGVLNYESGNLVVKNQRALLSLTMDS